MPIFTNRLEAKLKELGVLEKAKRYAIKTFDDCDNMDINSIASAFTWSDTDEGGDFWKGIDNVTAAEFTF